MLRSNEPFYIVDEKLSGAEIDMLPILLPPHYELMRQYGGNGGQTMPTTNLELHIGRFAQTIEVDEDEVIRVTSIPREYHTVATLKDQSLSYQIGIEERLSSALNGIKEDSDSMAVAVNIPLDAFPEDGLVISAYPCWYKVSYAVADKLFTALAQRGIDESTPGFPTRIAREFYESCKYNSPDSYLTDSRWMLGFLLAVAPDLYHPNDWRAERSLSIHRRVGNERFTLVSSFEPLKPHSNSIVYGVDKSAIHAGQVYYSHECDVAENPEEFAALRGLVARDLIVYWLIEGSGQKDSSKKWYHNLIPGFGGVS